MFRDKRSSLFHCMLSLAIHPLFLGWLANKEEFGEGQVVDLVRKGALFLLHLYCSLLL